MTYSLLGTRVVLCAIAFTVAGCSSNPAGPDEIFGSAAGTKAEQRVGSTGAGGGGCSPGCSIVLVTLSLITTGGDQISGACEMVSEAAETTIEDLDGCRFFTGTGRFEGLSAGIWEFDLSSPTTVEMFFQMELPKLGGETFQTRNDLDAVRTVEVTETCSQFVRVNFSGTLEHFGRVTGEISYCSPSA